MSKCEKFVQFKSLRKCDKKKIFFLHGRLEVPKTKPIKQNPQKNYEWFTWKSWRENNKWTKRWRFWKKKKRKIHRFDIHLILPMTWYTLKEWISRSFRLSSSGLTQFIYWMLKQELFCFSSEEKNFVSLLMALVRWLGAVVFGVDWWCWLMMLIDDADWWCWLTILASWCWLMLASFCWLMVVLVDDAGWYASNNMLEGQITRFTFNLAHCI